MVPFVRQLGAESGVQLNPLVDGSEIPSVGNADQKFGIIMRATRGRIDKPFLVDRGNVFKKLGKGETIRVNALNEAWVSVVEALNNGAYEAVVQRLVTDQAKVKYAVLRRRADVKPKELAPTETVDNVFPAIIKDKAGQVVDPISEFWGDVIKVDDTHVKIELRGEKLKKHQNEQGVEGLWCGFAVVAPEEATKVKVDDDPIEDLEKNVHNKDKGMAIYWDVAKKSKVSVTIQFFKGQEGNEPIGEPITYEADTSKVIPETETVPEFEFSVEDELPTDKFVLAVNLKVT